MKGTIRRRGKNSWELRFDLPHGPDGKRRRQHVNVKGKKADAERKLRDTLASLDRGLPLDSRKVTVRDYMDRWLRDYAVPHTRPRTSERYASDIRLHISPSIGHLQLAQLRPADIQELEARLLDRGKSRRSVKHVHVVLKQALKHAARWGLIHYNPAEAVDPPKGSVHEIQPPNVEQVRAILVLASETPYGSALTFMARTGCRRSECLGLRWVDLDLDTGTASIVRSLQRVGKRGLVFQPPKSAKSKRRIALDGRTVDILRIHQGAQVLSKAELGNIYQEYGLVFPGQLGKPLDPATLTRNFIKLAKRAGLDGIRLHDLRHFHATLLLKNNTHLKVVQERLGHASIATTGNIYSHVAPEMQRDAAETFAVAMDAGGL